MARPNLGLAYPERFYAAAAYAGFGGLPSSSSSSSAILVSRLQDDVALLLYGLYQQATVGPCHVPKPGVWNPVEHSKWTSWNGLGSMTSTEAMRLFVKILEEEDPSWYSRVPDSTIEPVVDAEMHVHVAELRQKLQAMESLQKEVELLQLQKATSEQAALNARATQNSGGLWGWLAGTPEKSDSR
ncbi:putative acyl-CoA-binding protein, ACBP [Dioscorea sansibarensis]